MKTILTFVFASALWSQGFAISIQSEVVSAELDEDGQLCCARILHLIYDTDGTFMSYAFTEMGMESGDCCKKTGAIEFFGPPLEEAKREQLEKFMTTRAFRDSERLAMQVYTLTKSGKMSALKISKNADNRYVLEFDATEEADFTLVIKSLRNARNGYQQNVYASLGHNTIELTYTPIIDGHDDVLFRLVSENEGFAAFYTEWK